MGSDGSKVCINCGAIALDKSGARLTKLYDETLYKKSKILKLVECRRCGEVVDNYSEYEGTIILLDLALRVEQQHGASTAHLGQRSQHLHQPIGIGDQYYQPMRAQYSQISQ